MMRRKLLVLLSLVTCAAVIIPSEAIADGELGDRHRDLVDSIGTAAPRDRPRLLVELAQLLWQADPERAIEAADEVIGLGPSVVDDMVLADAFEIKGRSMLGLDRYTESLEQMRKAEVLYRRIDDETKLARCLGYQGMALKSLGELWPAIDVVEKAAAIFRRSGDQRGIAAATNNLGIYCELVGEYDRAIGLHLESLDIERSIGRVIGIANNLNSIGNIHSRMENYTQARQHYQQALELFDDLDETYGASQCLMNIGRTYREQGEYRLALGYLERALEAARSLDRPTVEAKVLTNMGIVFRNLGEYERSLELYGRAAAIEEELGEAASLALTLQSIGVLYLHTDRPSDAIVVLQRAEAIAVDTGLHKALTGTYFSLAEAYAQLGDYRRAFESLQSYDEVREAALAEEKHLAVSELQARYDADRRREEIEQLKRDNEIQQLHLSRARLTTALVIAVLVGAAGAGLILVRRYRSLLAFWRKRVFVGPFRVGEQISSGGMGIVYRATNVTEPGRTVALKVIREEFAGDDTQRKRFINEGRIIDGIKHPNIVTVFDRGEHNEQLYIAMEYLAGRTLAEVIGAGAATGKAIENHRCLRIMSRLADAVASIHAMGIVHRDIKPNNVMITDVGERSESVKLLDFGTAKLDTVTTLTAAGELVGTVSYLAPERIRHGEPTAASDIFSLGVVFYELLTLEHPFPADDPVLVLKQILETDPVPPDAFRADSPDGLRALVMAMLDKDPARRPSDESLIHRIAQIELEAA